MSQPSDINEQQDAGFLQRWSQRKQDVQAEAEAEEELSLEAEVETPAELTDEDMPAVETLTESSDYSGFLSPKVSDELQRIALRKLFKAAVFNQRDGLDDYDDDFTSFAELGDIITSDMQHQIDMAKKKLEEMADEKAESDEEPTVKQTAEQVSVDNEPVELAEAVDPEALDDDVESEL